MFYIANYRKGRQARSVPNHKKRSRSNGYSVSYVWLWLLSGAFVGILGITSAYLLLTGKWSLDKLKPDAAIKLSPKKLNAAKVQKQPALAAKKKSSPRFEFYQLLPGMEVPIPDPTSEQNKSSTPKLIPLTPKAPISAEESSLTPSRPAPSVSLKKPNTIEKPSLPKVQTKLAAAQYLIQAGAYRGLGSAEAFKTRLQRLGFHPRLQKVEAEDGTWFRIIIGPFPSEIIASKHKNTLAKQRIEGILILQRH